MIELLESRIAPAVLVTYVEPDGDTVQLRISKGSLAQVHLEYDQPGGYLSLLQLSDGPAFAGADLSLKVVKRGSASDGEVSFGTLDAQSVEHLGVVRIEGSVQKILLGTPNFNGQVLYPTTTLAARVLEVGSFKAAPSATTDGYTSIISGEIRTLVIHGDLDGAYLRCAGKIDALRISGSIRGESGTNAGSLVAVGDIGSALIAGSILGGSGESSGHFGSDGGRVGVLELRGSVLGGAGSFSGTIGPHQIVDLPFQGPELGGAFGSLRILGSVTGGAGDRAGAVDTSLPVSSLVLKGSVLAGGFLHAGDVGEARIYGSVDGGAVDVRSFRTLIIAGDVSASGAAPSTTYGDGVVSWHMDGGGLTIGGSVVAGSTDASGVVGGDGRLRSIAVHGDIVGGAGKESGLVRGTSKVFTLNGSILGGSGERSGFLWMDAVTAVKGSVVAGRGLDSGSLYLGFNAAHIYGSVIGREDSRSFIGAAALTSLRIDGDVSFTDVLIGYAIDRTPYASAFAELQSFVINGNLTNSNIAVGVSAGSDGKFGTADDRLLGQSGDGQIHARLGTLTVKGRTTGDGAGTPFAIVAGEFGTTFLNGVKTVFHPQALDQPLLLDAGNVIVRETHTA